MIVDTNILIAHLQGDEVVIGTLSQWKRSGRVLFISSISRAEVLSHPDLTGMEISEILLFFTHFASVSFDDQLAEVAGDLRRRYSLSLPDAAIAATALTRGVPLVTRDRALRRVREITVVKI